MTKIAILLPYKENYTINKAGAASIWVKDYLSNSKLKNLTTIYGNLDKKDQPLTKNFINFEENKRDFYLTVNHFNLGYKEELEAIAPRIFSNKFELILSLSEELVKNADKIRNSILIKLNIYEKNYPYLPDSNDEEIIKFQLDLENEFHEYSNVGQEFQKTFQEIVMLLQGLQGFQN